jgi:cytochrome c oxidase subunit III
MASIGTTASVDTARVLLPGSDRRPEESLDFSARLRRARLGLIVALTGVVMIFVSYSSAYIVRQGLPTLDPRTGTRVHDWLPLHLPSFLLINTLVLLISTITMELARRQSAREVAAALNLSVPSPTHPRAEAMPWLALTTILGLAFLAGQWLVWTELGASGVYLATSPSSSFFYLLTGVHGIHLLGGILALLAAVVAAAFQKSVATRGVVVDVSAWYWHFMTFLWVYILGLLEFAH